MTFEILVKYIHFICIFTIVATLSVEWILLEPTLTKRKLKTLSRVDSLYGLSALVLLIAGLVLWFGVGKPAHFYSKNWIFHTKLTAFIIIGLLSIYPTIFFIKNQKGNDEDTVNVPSLIKKLVGAELILLLVIPLLATLMAKGIGYFG